MELEICNPKPEYYRILYLKLPVIIPGISIVYLRMDL